MIPIRDDNPTRIYPIVTIGLILANVMVFLHQILLGPKAEEAFVWRMGAIPYDITHLRTSIPRSTIPLYLTPFTAMFTHGGLLHVGGNMLYLWVFGNNIEDLAGHVRFLTFYLLCGLIAATAHIMASPNSQVPMVGASGAVAGILGAYLVSYPRARVQVLVPIFFFLTTLRIRAVIVLGMWFVIQVMNASAMPGGGGGGVAWYAHIGGFLAGMILIFWFRRYGARRRE